MSLDGRRVAVTGAAGFIGSHLVDALVREGATVRACVRYTSRGDIGALEWLPPETRDAVEVHRGDLRDVESVTRSLDGVETVFHLGAQISVPYSNANPRDFFETNVLGTLNVAQAALTHGVALLVHASTSEVYGGTGDVAITEDAPLRPRSPYAASKVAADKVVESWGHAYGLDAVVVRPFNTFGPRQSARALVPAIITQALAGGAVRLGSLHPTRDLLYVEDTVAGYVRAALADGARRQTVHLGTGSDVSVGEVVARVGALLGRELEVEHDEQRVRPPDGEVQRLVADWSAAERELGWRPAVTLDEGLERTIAWIRANAGAFEPQRYTT